MKLSPLLLITLATASTSPTNAFVGRAPVSAFPTSTTTTTTTTTTALFANSNNIRAAMEATQLYGPTSVEARLAWETVEEFDARATASNAYSGNEANKWTEEQLAWANQEIMTTLQWIVGQRTHNLAMSQELMKDVAAQMHAIKLTPPSKKPGQQIPGLWDAKLKAREMTQQYGNYSPQAKLAWEEVEEIASTGLENAMASNGGANNKLQECWLTQAAEACLAFEELDRFINYEYQKHSSYPQQQQQQQQQQQDQYQYQQDHSYQQTQQGQYDQQYQYHQDQYQQGMNYQY